MVVPVRASCSIFSYQAPHFFICLFIIRNFLFRPFILYIIIYIHLFSPFTYQAYHILEIVQISPPASFVCLCLKPYILQFPRHHEACQVFSSFFLL